MTRPTPARDKPAATGELALPVLTVAAVLAAVLSVAVFVLLGWRVGIAGLVMNGAGWTYNLGLKATVFSGLTYLVGLACSRSSATWRCPRSRPGGRRSRAALLGLGAHIANVLPDLRADEATGVRGLPHRLGARAAHRGHGRRARRRLTGRRARARLSARTALVAAGVAVLLACGAAALGLRRPDSPFAFYAALGVALIDVVLFVAEI